MNKTPAFLFTQLGWTKDNVQATWSRRSIPHTLQFKIIEDFAPTLVLNLMATVAASVVEKKVAMANEENGDLGNELVEDPFGHLGRLQLVVVESQRVGHAWRPIPATISARQRPSASSSATCPSRPPSACCWRRATSTSRWNLQPDQLKPLASNKDVKVEIVPVLRHLVHRPEPGRRAAEEPEGAAGAEIPGRLPGHGQQLPQGPLRACTRPSCRLVCSARSSTTPTSSTSPRRRRCWPRRAIRTASS